MKSKVYYSRNEIASAVERVAQEIDRFYNETSEDSPVVVVCILKGGVIFFADLVRQLHFPLVFDFIRASSYGAEKTSSGEVQITQDCETPLQGRRVLIVDDLVDSGLTLATLKDVFLARGAVDVRCAVLVEKKTKVERAFKVDFAALSSEPVFFAGYGLDDQERMRKCPDLLEIL